MEDSDEREVMATTRTLARRASAPSCPAMRRLIIEDESETGHSDGETIGASLPAKQGAARRSSHVCSEPEEEIGKRECNGFHQRQPSGSSILSAAGNEDFTAKGETDESQLLDTPPHRAAAAHVFGISKMYRKPNRRTHEAVLTSQSPPVSFMTRSLKRGFVRSAVGDDDSETAAYRQEEARLQTHMRAPSPGSSKAMLKSVDERWRDIACKQLHHAILGGLRREDVSEELKQEMASSDDGVQDASTKDVHAEESLSCDDITMEIHSPRQGTEMQELDYDSSSQFDITITSEFNTPRRARGMPNEDDVDTSMHSVFDVRETVVELGASEHVDDGGAPTDCRICGGGDDTGPLVEACNCKGSVALVHGHCLKRWIKERPDVKEGTQLSKETYLKLTCCEICKQPYRGEFGRLAKKAAKQRMARLRRQQQDQQERGRRRLDGLAMMLRALAIICGAGTVVASPFLFFQCHKMGSQGCAKLKGQPILLGIVAVICLALLVLACRRLAAECR
eukprot:CAMPEP_0177717424 /NCGR_PEP_ID=MMETSP0484_2-20121128/15038_1 /TAXON_ID=354590 /ORGANISM="Rhodomonas lens, Strain RHODO" /LENGTH=507 /DNA_ID=CAMNT_0019229525 /DNA_START=9 /DNA_END=1528 /DNA_ORIENTATION=-